MPGKPSNQESLLPRKTSNQETLMPGKSFHQDKIMPGKSSNQDKTMPGKPSHQDKIMTGKSSNQDKTMPDKPSNEESLLLGNSFSIPHPLGAAGSVASSFSRRSLMSRTEGKERSLLLMKMKSRLTGLEEDGAQVMEGLKMLENKVKGLVEEAKMTAGEFESEGGAMEKYAGISQYLLQVEDEITIISAALSQWNNDTSDSEVSSVEVLNDESKTKEVIMEESKQKFDLLKKAEVQGSISGITNIVKKVNDGNLLEDNLENSGQNKPVETAGMLTNNLDKKAENCKLVNKRERIEISNNLADADNKTSEDILEGNLKNDRAVKKHMEAVEIGSNSPSDNFISLNDLNNENYKGAKERFVDKEGKVMNENRDIADSNRSIYVSSTKISKLQNVNSQIPAELKQKLEALQINKTEQIHENRDLISLDNSKQFCNDIGNNNNCDSSNRKESIVKEHLKEEALVVTKLMKNEEKELDLDKEIELDSLGSTWEDDNTRRCLEAPITEKTELTTLSSVETVKTKCKVLEWLEYKCEEVNNATLNSLDSSVNNATPNPRASLINKVKPNPQASSVITATPNLQAFPINSATPNSLDSSVNTATPNPQASIKSFRAKLKPKQVSQSKDKTDSSDVLMDQVLNFLPTKERSEIPPVKLGSLKISEDESSSFLFKLSSIENPGKFYVHPVQDEMKYIYQIHNEIQSHPRRYPDARLVVPDTVWSMYNLDRRGWCRVRVETRSATSASVRYIDFGTREERVDLKSLRHLPSTWVRQLPGLAVQCNLGGCTPVGKDWDEKSTAAFNQIVGSEKQRGVIIGENNGSLDLVLIKSGFVVNQQMVEGGFALSQMTNYFKTISRQLGAF